MHHLALILALLIPCMGFSQTLNPATAPYVSALLKPASGAASPTYLIKQGFEGTGYDNGETWNESISTVNEDYATSPAPLDGFQSCLVGIIETYSDFTGQSEVWGYHMLNASVISGARMAWSFRDASDNNLLQVRILSDGAVRVQDNGVHTADSAAGVITTSTTYHIWTHYLKGTGANSVCEVWVSSSPTKPGSATASLSNGNGTANCSRVVIMGWNDGDWIHDKVRVDDAVIGSSPE